MTTPIFGYGDETLVSGTNTIYFTSIYDITTPVLRMLNTAATNYSATFSLKQVTIPSATGVTIVSAYDGTTYSWTSIESGFSYVDSSGYTYAIEDVQGHDPLASLEWSNDGGHTWSNAYTTAIGEIGEYGWRAVWNKLGAGRSRIFRVTISDPVKVAIHGAYAELEALAS
jgi:hypothetical protein